MRKAIRLGIALSLPLLSLSPAHGQRGYPRVETVFPGAVSRGATTDVLLTGSYNLRDAYRILFEGEGVSASVVQWLDMADPNVPKEKRKPFEPEGLKLRITVAKDTTPGIRPFRVLTKGSLSAVAHLLITEAPSVTESEPNDSGAQAQRIEIPQTLNGLLDQDADVDVYSFQAKTGDKISFIVHAARLQRPVPHLEKNFSDITISLRDSEGLELAAADDWKSEDPQLFHEFLKDGTYYLHVWEARYHSGKGKWWYSLSALTTPQVTSVFPLVMQAGTKVKLRPEGFNLGGLDEYEFQAPRMANGALDLQISCPNGTSNVIKVGVTNLPITDETSASIRFPGAINGRISKDGETDRYRFSARKGDRYEFEVLAHRLGSLLDPLVELRNEAGKLLAAQDDRVLTVGQTADGLAFPVEKDPRLEWTAPADGQYELQVRDSNYFGSKDHVYHLAAKVQEEDFALVVDDDRMPVGPGESVTSVVTVERRNGFEGPIELGMRGLPDGIKFHESVIAAHLDQGNIVITGLPGALLDARDVEVFGVATVKSMDGREKKLERVAKPYAPMGQAGGRSFYPTKGIAVAVTEASDLIMEASPGEIRLRPGESATVSIKLTRNNYSGPVEMNVILWNLMQRFSQLPKGILYEEKLSKTSLGENEVEGKVTFRAEPDAPPLENYLMTVLGQITYNRVFMTRVAAPFRLSVETTGKNMRTSQ